MHSLQFHTVLCSGPDQLAEPWWNGDYRLLGGSGFDITAHSAEPGGRPNPQRRGKSNLVRRQFLGKILPQRFAVQIKLFFLQKYKKISRQGIHVITVTRRQAYATKEGESQIWSLFSRPYEIHQNQIYLQINTLIHNRIQYMMAQSEESRGQHGQEIPK